MKGESLPFIKLEGATVPQLQPAAQSPTILPSVNITGPPFKSEISIFSVKCHSPFRCFAITAVFSSSEERSARGSTVL